MIAPKHIPHCHQLYHRLTEGFPVSQLSIQCWSCHVRISPFPFMWQLSQLNHQIDMYESYNGQPPKHGLKLTYWVTTGCILLIGHSVCLLWIQTYLYVVFLKIWNCFQLEKNYLSKWFWQRKGGRVLLLSEAFCWETVVQKYLNFTWGVIDKISVFHEIAPQMFTKIVFF